MYIIFIAVGAAQVTIVHKGTTVDVFLHSPARYPQYSYMRATATQFVYDLESTEASRQGLQCVLILHLSLD